MMIQRTVIDVHPRLCDVLDYLHLHSGKQDVETVRGGTQVNLCGCEYKSVIKTIRALPDWAKITGIWSTRIEKGGYHIRHSHPQGSRSGVFYARVGEGGDLVIGDRRYHPEPGMVLIFPSDVTHFTTEYEGEAARLTIAFDMKQ